MKEIWETQVWSLGREGPLEEEMAAHSSILVWRIPMDRGAWWATVHGVTKSWTWLKWLSMQACTDKIKPFPPTPAPIIPILKSSCLLKAFLSIVLMLCTVMFWYLSPGGTSLANSLLQCDIHCGMCFQTHLSQYACSDQDWLTRYKRLFNTVSRKMALCRPWWSFLTLESAFV